MAEYRVEWTDEAGLHSYWRPDLTCIYKYYLPPHYEDTENLYRAPDGLWILERAILGRVYDEWGHPLDEWEFDLSYRVLSDREVVEWCSRAIPITEPWPDQIKPLAQAFTAEAQQRWIARSSGPVRATSPGAGPCDSPAAAGQGQQASGAARPVRRRSRTQREVDEAIRGYKAEHEDLYQDWAARVEAGSEEATAAARRVFGRNRVARALDISAGMVSKSPVWKEIATALKLQGRPKGNAR